MSKFSRTIANILCGVLVIGAVAGAGTALYMGVKNNGWFDEYLKPDTEQSEFDNGGENEVAEGMVIPSEFNGKQMRVTSTALSPSAYSDYGVSAQAENAYTLTAEVLPDYASDKTVNWSVAWADGSSTWASGKNVNNYVTVTPSSSGSTTAVLACTQDFGEPVMLSVSSRSNPNVCGIAYIHYYQRIKSLNYNIKLDGETVSSSADSHGVYKVDFTGAEKNYTVELNPVYSAYTLTDNYTTTISGKLSSTFGYTATSTLKELTIPAGLLGGEPEMSTALANWCSSAKALINYDSTTRYYCYQAMKSMSLTAEDKAHPKYVAYNSVVSKITVNSTSKSITLPSGYSSTISSYTPPAYTYYGASISDYNTFVSAVKACNTAGVGVLQYDINIQGTYSSYSTVLNLSYNDEFKLTVQNINLSDVTLSF